MTPSRILSRTALIAALLALSLTAGLTAYVGVSSAQSPSDLPQNATETATEEPIEGSVGPIDILDYELANGQMTLTVEVREPTPYAVSDALAGLQEGGVTEVPTKQGTLRSGRQEITLQVTTIDDAGAVTLSTPGEAVRVQSGTVGAGRPPVAFSKALLAVIVSGVGAGYYSYRKTRDRLEDDDDPEVNRIA